MLQLLNFWRVGGFFQQLDLRYQPLIAGILILQRHGFQHRFRFIGTVQGNQRFRQQQANLALLVRQLPGVFQQRQRFGVVLFLHQRQRLLRFELLFARQELIQQRAHRFFRLRAFEAVDRLTVLEQVNRRDCAQAKLRSQHLFGIAVNFSEGKQTVVLGGEALQYRRQLLAMLAARGPEIEQHRRCRGLL